MTARSRSTAWIGRRIVRPASARPRWTAWRIHQVAYVENLWPRRQSKRSTARIEAEHAVLDEIEQAQALALVGLGDRDDQPQIALHHAFLGRRYRRPRCVWRVRFPRDAVNSGIARIWLRNSCSASIPGLSSTPHSRASSASGAWGAIRLGRRREGAGLRRRGSDGGISAAQSASRSAGARTGVYRWRKDGRAHKRKSASADAVRHRGDPLPAVRVITGPRARRVRAPGAHRVLTGPRPRRQASPDARGGRRRASGRRRRSRTIPAAHGRSGRDARRPPGDRHRIPWPS